MQGRTLHHWLSLCLWLLLGAAGPLHASVVTSLSRTRIQYGEPLRLQIQIRGENSAYPDLAPLQRDFEILGRSQQRRTTVINGRRSTSRGITLTLRPRRAGEIEIAPIRVGDERSKPLRLEVTGETLAPAPPPVRTPNADANLPPSWQPYSPPAQQQPYQPPTPASQGGGSWPFWLLGLAGVAGLLAWWLKGPRKRPARSVGQAPVESEPVSDPLQEILDELEAAYHGRNAEAAREAWLRWGRYRWPESPPANLSRLAQRSPKAIAQAVSALDRAIYSPAKPLEWGQLSPRALLAGQSGTTPPPSHRS